jgi:hypothetical protein
MSEERGVEKFSGAVGRDRCPASIIFAGSACGIVVADTK